MKLTSNLAPFSSPASPRPTTFFFFFLFVDGLRNRQVVRSCNVRVVSGPGAGTALLDLGNALGRRRVTFSSEREKGSLWLGRKAAGSLWEEGGDPTEK